jgi:HEAT repeat protein
MRCQYAAEVLGRIGREAAVAIPVLIRVAKRQHGQTEHVWQLESRASIRRALWRIGSKSLDSLIAAIDDEDPAVQLLAVETIPMFGSEAKHAVPLLVGRITEGPPGVRIEVIRALAQLGSLAQSAIPKLQEISRRSTGLTKEMALEALETIESALRREGARP